MNDFHIYSVSQAIATDHADTQLIFIGRCSHSVSLDPLTMTLPDPFTMQGFEHMYSKKLGI